MVKMAVLRAHICRWVLVVQEEFPSFNVPDLKITMDYYGFLWIPVDSYVAAGVIGGLSLMEDAPPVFKIMLEEYAQMDLQERFELVRFCRVVKVFKESQRRLIISFGGSPKALEMRNHVIGFLKGREAWDFKMGRPPAGHMERELGLWLKEFLSN